MRALAVALLLVLTPLARADAPLDLNAATAEQLERLPGIGPSKAKAIVQDRQQNGPFHTIDELDRVKGIGPKMIDRLRAHVRVAAAAPAKSAPAKSAPAPHLDALDRESPEGKLNLNLATEDELQSIDGITRANAKIIVAWRQKKGAFQHIAELSRVPGLPPKLLQTVQFFVTVRLDARTVREEELVASGISQGAAGALVAARQKRALTASELDQLPGASAQDRAALREILWFR